MIKKIPNSKVQKLSQNNLLRSKKMTKEYQKVSQEQRLSFIKKIMLEIQLQGYSLNKNDYPYDIFCKKNNFEHYTLFYSSNYINFKDIQIITAEEFNYYFSNPQNKQSIKEIKHIHFFRYKKPYDN